MWKVVGDAVTERSEDCALSMNHNDLELAGQEQEGQRDRVSVGAGWGMYGYGVWGTVPSWRSVYSVSLGVLYSSWTNLC